MAFFVGARFVSIVYLLTFGASNLPRLVIWVMSAIVLYGAVLIIKKFASGIFIKEMLWLFAAQAVAAGFNLWYMRLIGYALRLSFPEIITVGTFLDILVAACVLYYGIKQMRRAAAIARETGSNLHV